MTLNIERKRERENATTDQKNYFRYLALGGDANDKNKQ